MSTWDLRCPVEQATARELDLGETRAPTVTVLLDPTDDAMVTRTLLEAHAPAAGVVTVHPTPGLPGAAALAADILLSLGRSMQRLAAHRISGPDPAWSAVAAWISAEAIAHLVVLRAHRLSTEQRRRLLELARISGVHLVLVWHAHLLDLRRELPSTDLGYRFSTELAEVTGSLTERRNRRSRATVESALDSRPLPPLPAAEAGAFRAATYEQLSASDFARVDAVYDGGLRAACLWLADCALGELDHTDDHAHTSRSLFPAAEHAGTRSDDAERPPRWADEVGLFRFLGDLVGDSPTAAHSVARLRGAQTGFALHGCRLELPAHLAYSVGPGLTTTPITNELVDRIRAELPGPSHAAALAVLLCTGSTPQHLSTIPTTALTADAGAIVLDGLVGGRRSPRVYAIPVPARPLLAAARTFVTLGGPRGQKKLLSAGVGSTAQHLRTSAHACGLSFPALHGWEQCWVPRAAAWWTGPYPRAAAVFLVSPRETGATPPHRLGIATDSLWENLLTWVGKRAAQRTDILVGTLRVVRDARAAIAEEPFFAPGS